ncbi:MAG: NYN domain-containing protein [Rhodobacteraceae bacterium]|jgi:uncharacterized LabA/DUF88 family protein|nr:NYN domain-containing protein [Paracoccaceae bacterium]
MSHRFSVLIDGGFFVRKLQGVIKKRPDASDVASAIDALVGHGLFNGYELLRVYYYDARPATGRLRNPISGQDTVLSDTEVYRRNQSFLDALELRRDVALRLGETSPNGWKLKHEALKDPELGRRPLQADDLVMDIEQKGVDLRIGLDIARLSLKQLVQTIVVVTGDSDLVPAFKFARREGVRVVLSHMGHGVKRDLRAHTDLVLEEIA